MAESVNGELATTTVVLLLTVALVGVEDHVPLHGLGPFSLGWIVFLVNFFFQICS